MDEAQLVDGSICTVTTIIGGFMFTTIPILCIQLPITAEARSWRIYRGFNEEKKHRCRFLGFDWSVKRTQALDSSVPSQS